MSPTEPGWYQSPDDPSDIERWYTGAEWSEYTRPSEAELEPTAEVIPDTIDPDTVVDIVDIVDIVDTAEVTDTVDTDVRDAIEAADAIDMTDTVDSTDTDDGWTGDHDAAGTNRTTTAPDAASVDIAPSAPVAPIAPIAPVSNAAPMTASASDQAALNIPGAPIAAMAGAPPMQPPTAQPASPGGFAAPSTGPPPPPSENRAAVAQAMAFGRSWMDRLIAMGNASESGVDRNVAVLTWLPLFGPVVWIAYLFTGRSWSSTGRGHVVGSINLALTMLFVQMTVVGSFLLGQLVVGLGVLLLLVGGSLFALVIWFMSQRYGQSVGHWVWFGVIVLLGFLAVVGDDGMLELYGAVMGMFALVLIVANVVRARLGMARSFLAFPVVPVLSER